MSVDFWLIWIEFCWLQWFQIVLYRIVLDSAGFVGFCSDLYWVLLISDDFVLNFIDFYCFLIVLCWIRIEFVWFCLSWLDLYWFLLTFWVPLGGIFGAKITSKFVHVILWFVLIFYWFLYVFRDLEAANCALFGVFLSLRFLRRFWCKDEIPNSERFEMCLTKIH